MRFSFLGLMLFFIFDCCMANQHQVFVKDGNVYKDNQQITYSNRDRSPTVSPDGKMIAYIRQSADKIPDDCIVVDDSNHAYADQIWLYSIESNKEYLLVPYNFSCRNLKEMITSVNQIQFSPDNKILYFQTPAWVTSGALHSVTIEGIKKSFLMPSMTFEVVPKGTYKGHLIIQQHRYFIGGGSYDWYWLYNPQGKEEGTLGSEIKDSQREYLESE